MFIVPAKVRVDWAGPPRKALPLEYANSGPLTPELTAVLLKDLYVLAFELDFSAAWGWSVCCEPARVVGVSLVVHFFTLYLLPEFWCVRGA